MIGVAVMGCGVVGSGVVNMLLENRDIIKKAVGDDVFPLYMLDIRPIEAPEGVTLTSRFEDVLADPRVNIAVETIGGARLALEYTRRCLERGIHVVTSNKELVADHGDELLTVAREHHAAYLYEASVGGGIPILRPLREDLCANRITCIQGIVNGSTNYLLTEMTEKGVCFPEALEEARRLGYAEANPAADVEGWDARRKLAILANAAFGAHLKDNEMIPTTGISHLTAEDMRAAEAFSGAVKLIAHAEVSADGTVWEGWVHPCFVPSSHPLYGVRDVFNGILVHGNFVDDVMFYGRGAGSRPTASAVVSDIVDAARHAPTPCTPEQSPTLRPANARRRLLMRVREYDLGLLPDSEARELDGGFAVMTCPMCENDWRALCAALGDNLLSAVPLYVLD